MLLVELCPFAVMILGILLVRFWIDRLLWKQQRLWEDLLALELAKLRLMATVTEYECGVIDQDEADQELLQIEADIAAITARNVN